MSTQFWDRSGVQLALALGIALVLTSGVLMLARASQAAPTAPPTAGNPISFGPAMPVFTPTEDVTALTWADLDRDGAADLAFAAGDEVRIAANAGTSPTNWMPPMLVESGLGQVNALLAADLDRDACIDLVALSGDGGDGRVRVWRNPGDPFVVGWDERGNVAQSATIAYLTGAVGDLDGDAAPDLIVGGSDGILRLWRNPMAPGDVFTAEWGAPAEIALAAGSPQAVEVADVNRDGRLDLLVAVGDALQIWENPGDPFGVPWANEVTLSGQGSALKTLFVADLDGDGRPDPVVGDADGNLLAWSNPITPGHALTGGWPSPATIGSLGEPISSLVGGDFDHDGQVDLMVGGAGPTHAVQAWRNDGDLSGVWSPRTLGTRFDAVHALVAVDADADGDMDLLSGSGAGDAAQVVWWPNTLIHRDAPFPASILPLGESDSNVKALVQGDLNRDGWLDLVSGDAEGKIVIWENDGNPMQGTWSSRMVGDVQDLTSLALGDLDGDGALEIVSGHEAPPRLLVWQNQGASLDGPWVSNEVGDPGTGIGGLAVADLDLDGKPDLVSGCGVHLDAPSPNHKVTLWQNDGSPFDGPWLSADAAVISYSVNAVTVGDLDQDGWLDIAVGTDHAPAFGSAMEPVPRAQWTDAYQVHALRNPDRPFSDTWSVVAVGRDPATVTLGPEEDPSHYHGYWGATVYGINLADFDRDGDLDIVTAEGIEADYQVKVWENDGTPFDGQPKTFHWTWQPVAVWYGRPPSPPWMGGSALTVDVADFNLDGWPDIVPGITDWLRVWFENSGSPFGTFITDTHWTRHLLSLGSVKTRALAVEDYDRDGDPDVASGRDLSDGPELGIWPNRGGGVAQIAVSSGASPLQQGFTKDILKIYISHNGHPGEDDIRVANWRLRFTDLDGLPLTSQEINALVDTLWVYRDTTDNRRWSTYDRPVVTVTNMALSGSGGTLLVNDSGYQVLPFGESDPLAVLSPGESEVFFVVAAISDTAMYQTPNAFQVWFDADADSLIQEANGEASVAVSDVEPVNSAIQIVGPLAQVSIEDAPSGLGDEIGDATVCSGYSLDLYAVGQDELGQYVSSQPVTWTLIPLTGGVAPEDLIPSADATRARLHGHLTGTARISVEHAVLGSDVTGVITVAPAPARMTLSAEPSSVLVGGTMTAALRVHLQDVHGMPVVDGVPVTFTIVSGSDLGSLPADPLVAATTAGEAATVFAAGTKTGQVTVSAATGGLTEYITVTLRPGPLAALHVSRYSTYVYAGLHLHRGPSVAALDSYDNVKTDYAGSVHFLTSDPQATFSTTVENPYTFTSQDQGVHEFDGSGFSFGTAGWQVITVTDGAIAATTEPIDVRPGLETGSIELTVSSQVITAGLPVTCTVEAFDTYGNSRGDWTPWCDYSIEKEAGGWWAGNVYTSGRDGTWHIVASTGYDPPKIDSVELQVIFVGHRAYLPLVMRGR